jgi:hypothetical protein
MSIPKFKRLGMRLALLGAATALMAGFSASTAFAAGSITAPEPEVLLTTGVPFQIEGTLDANADLYALAICAKGCRRPPPSASPATGPRSRSTSACSPAASRPGARCGCC